MKLLPLNCNNCGAPLEAPANARFLTCGFCDSRLSITQTGASYSTEVLDALSKQTHRLAEDMAAVRREKEIARLDREWEAKRATYTGSDGRLMVSSVTGAVIVALALCIIGLGGTYMAVSNEAPKFVAIGGILFAIFGIGLAIGSYQNGRDYHQAHAQYQRHRRLLMARR